MSIFVFVGPTLAAEDARRELAAVYLPPAAQGDVYRAALKRPRAIGIIDGYFERVPAVWHKEILWAMAQGIHVFGSASMGALRAAELAAFGMEGVGQIFEAYRTGLIHDDDEVAVAHGPADAGYRAQSEAMVNVRATLAAAVESGVIRRESADRLAQAGKDLFYPDRTYPRILAEAATRGIPAADLAAFRAWLPTGRVDQKREDALAMLRAMARWAEADPRPKRVTYVFEHTVYWDAAMRSAGSLGDGARSERDTVLGDLLLEELSLDAERYADATHGALLRHLALAEAQRHGLAVSREALQETADRFRLARGLHAPEDVAAWIADNDVTVAGFEDLLREEALLGWVRNLVGDDALHRLADHLRISGDYARLRGRSEDKQRALESWGLTNPGLEDVGLDEPGLLAWYFGHLGRAVPPDLDAYARDAGFADAHGFRRAVLREYCYLRLKEHGRL
jgi:hypothetical protein